MTRPDDPPLAEGFEAAQPPQPGPLGVTAARGVGLLVGRTLGLQLLTAGVTIVLARLLTPADYGLFALALAVQLVGQRFAELGMPSALIRQQEEPSELQQSAIAGLMVTSAICISAGLVLIAFVLLPALGVGGKAMRVAAVATAAMPFYAARAMPMVLMERNLRFGRVALVETADTLAFNAFALAAALGGLGAFSLAGAVPAGGLAGMAAAWFAQPFFRRPRLDLKPVRPLLGFGLKVSVIQGVNLLRELGFVGILAAVGGAPMAGFYSMSKRLFSFPIALSSAVFRVSFPTLSRDAAARPARAARVAVYTAIAAGLPLALVAGAAQPLIRVVLGSEWDPTADIVIAGSLGMLLTASLNATMISYTLADGKAGPAIGAAVVEAAIMFGMAATLTDAWGETGVGLMLTISTLAGTGILIFQAHAVVRDSLASVAKTSAIAAVATVAAQLLDPPDDVGGLVLSLAVVTVVWTVLEMVFARADLRRMIGLARPMFSRGRSG